MAAATARVRACRVLDGIRVVDLSSEIAGPYCTKLLADAGADVVKVEPPAGDPMRGWRSGALFAFLNTSKRSVVGSLDDAAVRDLCAGADVVVESLEPGVIEGLGLLGANPRLVVASISPFGHTGPWADRPATEFTLQAWCGSTAGRGLPEEPPLAAGGRIGEWMGGTYAAVATVAALRSATLTDRGEHVDVALLDCMSLTMNTYTSVFAEFLGWPPLRRPTRMIEIPSIEPSSDGYFAITTNSAQQFADFLIMIERPDLLDDRDLALHMGRWKRRHEMIDILRAHTTKYTSEELLEQASLLRIPCGPVGNGETVTSFDHFVERGVFVENPGGRFVQPRVPYKISGLDPHPFDPAPELGEHQDLLLESVEPVEPGLASPEQAADAAGSGLPLDGIRVVDMTAWWAGPAATHMLACLGADVIKVESVTRPDLMRYTSTRPPTEDQWWEWGPLYHGANNTKRGITLDLTSPTGVDLLKRLIATADVLLENFTPRVMEQFGLGWDAVHEINPRLVMVRLPAYGLDGPWRERTGFAQTMEGITGMAWVTGWPDGPPVLPRGACDPLAAMHAVYATFLALRDREQSNEGRLVEATMIEAALNAAAEQTVEFSASGTVLSREGNHGPVAAPQNMYQCAGEEEWVAVAIATDDQWQAFREVLGRPEWATESELDTAAGRRDAHERIDTELAKWCAEHDARELAETLATNGIPAGYMVDARDIAHNPQLTHRGYFEEETHPVTGTKWLPVLPFRFASREEPWIRRAAPTLGEHNDEVLGGILGLTDDELAELRDANVIGERPVGA